jgi:hypothetical protein
VCRKTPSPAAARAAPPARRARAFVAIDPRASSTSIRSRGQEMAAARALPPLGELGWRNIQHDSPDVVELRERLIAEGGIRGLELLDPSIPDCAQRAAKLFHRDGFVLIRNALDAARLETIKAGCDHVIREMVALDPERLGNRGSHRYSFGAAASHFGSAGAWSVLIDPPIVLECLEAIFESPDFSCSGYGGDFVLPGCTHFQNLHRDMGDYLNDPSGRLTFLDMPCARLVRAPCYNTVLIPTNPYESVLMRTNPYRP